MFKKAWQEVHLLELIAVFLLVCTAGFYLKAYLDFESNYQTWLQSPDMPEGMSRAEALGLSGDFLGGVLNPILSFFSFLALLFTLRLQRRELNATMDELKKSTTAAESNVRLFTEQIRTQRLDAFSLKADKGELGEYKVTSSQHLQDLLIGNIGLFGLPCPLLVPPLPAKNYRESQGYAADQTDAVVPKPIADALALFVLVEQIVDRHAYSRPV